MSCILIRGDCICRETSGVVSLDAYVMRRVAQQFTLQLQGDACCSSVKGSGEIRACHTQHG